MSNIDPRPLLDINAVAERLGVSDRFVRRLVATRRIPYVKVGRLVRFHPEDIDHYTAAATRPAVR